MTEPHPRTRSRTRAPTTRPSPSWPAPRDARGPPRRGLGSAPWRPAALPAWAIRQWRRYSCSPATWRDPTGALPATAPVGSPPRGRERTAPATTTSAHRRPRRSQCFPPQRTKMRRCRRWKANREVAWRRFFCRRRVVVVVVVGLAPGSLPGLGRFRESTQGRMTRRPPLRLLHKSHRHGIEG